VDIHLLARLLQDAAHRTALVVESDEARVALAVEEDEEKGKQRYGRYDRVDRRVVPDAGNVQVLQDAQRDVDGRVEVEFRPAQSIRQDSRVPPEERPGRSRAQAGAKYTAG